MDDQYSQSKLHKRKVIVESWFEWTQEIFCDAVGYMMGESAFLHALSMYLRILGRNSFQLTEDVLGSSNHPVNWRRIRILASRARQMGRQRDAELLENEWNSIAKIMEIDEDYYGFYDSEYLPFLQRTIDDMLIEANPSPGRGDEMHSDRVRFSPVPMLNEAWYRFRNDPNGYVEWEREAIFSYMS